MWLARIRKPLRGATAKVQTIFCGTLGTLHLGGGRGTERGLG